MPVQGGGEVGAVWRCGQIDRYFCGQGEGAAHEKAATARQLPFTKYGRCGLTYPLRLFFVVTNRLATIRGGARAGGAAASG